MISSIAWVPAGVADPNPKKYEFSQAEQELIQMMKSQNLGDSNSPVTDGVEAKKSLKATIDQPDAADLPADLRMDEYSSDDDDDVAAGMRLGHLLVDESNDIMDENSLEDQQDEEKEQASVDSGNENDSDDDDLADVPDTREYTPVDVDGLQAMGLSEVGLSMQAYETAMDENDDEGSEADDIRLGPDDAMFVVAKTEEDFASLEVHVYEQNTGNLFIHHDIPLPAFPLCLAHGDVSPTGTAGNYCAVGTFQPGIEIWNLDVINALEPSCVLGGEDTSMADEIMRMNMLKQQRAPVSPMASPTKLRPGSHTDAIMGLSWNRIHRQVIASGSADKTVKLWDVVQNSAASTFRHHKNKVQSVEWHPSEGTLLATGSYDGTIAILDARADGKNVKKVKIPADCEAVRWDPFNSHLLSVASEDGTLSCFDVRNFSTASPVWSFVASEYGGISSFAYNELVPGMIASCSVDKTVTLWDVHNSQQPKPCQVKEMNVGKLYAVSFYPSAPWLLTCGGGGKEVAVWDMTREKVIQKVFADRIDPDNAALGSVTQNDTTANDDDFVAMMTPTKERESEKETVHGTNETGKKKAKKSKGKKKKAHKR